MLYHCYDVSAHLEVGQYSVQQIFPSCKDRKWNIKCL